MINSHLPKKFPIGIQTFEKIRTDDYIYVDKSAYVWNIAQRYSYVFLSRPRRFGKSLLTSTFEAYFSGRRDLFEGLAIASLESEWKSYPVLHFDWSTIKRGTVADFCEGAAFQLTRFEQQYGVTPVSQSLSLRLEHLIEEVARQAGVPVVVLVDEYDAPLLAALSDDAAADAIRFEMQAFYAPLKKLDPYLRFVFITGITKFSQLSIFSQLNNLHNISMLSDYAAVCGISLEELRTHPDLQAAVRVFAAEQGMSVDEAESALLRTYDGYRFAARSEALFNPFSLLSALSDRLLNHYWFSTGTPSFLLQVLKKFHTDITRLDGVQTDAYQFDSPTESMVSALPLFYQSGYLTIKDYDAKARIFTLGFPNEEVKVGVMRILYTFLVSSKIEDVPATLYTISTALRRGDVDEAMSVLTSYLASIPYQEGTLGNAVQTEGHFTSLLYVVFSLFNLYVRTQVRTARGRIDILLETKQYVYIMELKLDGSAAEAMAQINEKQYALPFALGNRQVVKVGINFSTATRTIADYCWQ